jgi:hypothetical protein
MKLEESTVRVPLPTYRYLNSPVATLCNVSVPALPDLGIWPLVTNVAVKLDGPIRICIAFAFKRLLDLNAYFECGFRSRMSKASQIHAKSTARLRITRKKGNLLKTVFEAMKLEQKCLF